MTITLDIKPDIEAELARQAVAHGVKVETFAAGLLEEAASHLSPAQAPAGARTEATNMVELFAPLCGLNLDFARDRDMGRDLSL